MCCLCRLLSVPPVLPVLPVPPVACAACAACAARAACDERLTDVRIFDIYQGDSIGKNRKSLALGLTFQDRSRTLKDEEVNDLVDAVVSQLKQQFNAALRD